MAAASATTTPANTLPSNCFLQPQSDDEEESFVVLCSSLPPESLLVDGAPEAVESIKPTVIQESLNLIANLSMKSTSSFPSMPKLKEHHLPPLLNENELGTTTTNSSVDLSPDEIQGRLDMLIEENIRLKDTLHQNNLAMKKQYETLTLWQDDVMKVHQSHKEKFAQTKRYIENLKLENSKLVDAVKSAKSAYADALNEIDDLKSHNRELEAAVEELRSFSLLENSKEADILIELGISHKRISELEGKVESLQNELTIKENTPPPTQVQVKNLQKEFTNFKRYHAQTKLSYDKKTQQSEALQKILLEEIKTLKTQLDEKEKAAAPPSSVKSVDENIQEQLMAAQMHITKLELLRNEDKEMINAKVEIIEKLETFIKEMGDTNDTVAALRAQLDLYKTDFEAERQAKNSIKAEKEEITEDLRNLQRRNQQLLEEVEQLRGNGFILVNTPQSSTASAPQNSPPPPSYTCPMCMGKFRSVRLVEDHIEYCIQNNP